MLTIPKVTVKPLNPYFWYKDFWRLINVGKYSKTYQQGECIFSQYTTQQLKIIKLPINKTQTKYDSKTIKSATTKSRIFITNEPPRYLIPTVVLTINFFRILVSKIA